VVPAEEEAEDASAPPPYNVAIYEAPAPNVPPPMYEAALEVAAEAPPPGYDETIENRERKDSDFGFEILDPVSDEDVPDPDAEPEEGAPSAPQLEGKEFTSSLPRVRTYDHEWSGQKMPEDPIPVLKWQLDMDAPMCSLCGTNFNFFVRRHHCRWCGSVVCVKCNQNTLIPKIGTKTQRFCNRCCLENEYVRSCFFVHNNGENPILNNNNNNNNNEE
jgi:hypothetical protein